MKKLSILLVLISAFAAKLQSQVSVNMTEENSNPDYFELHIPFLQVDFARSNSTFFAEFGGEFKMKKMYADLEYRISYLNGLEETYYGIDNITANSVYNYKASKEFKGMLGYMFIQNETATTVTFHLKSSGKVSYVTKVPATKTFYVMADLGMRKGFSWVYCGDKELKFDGVNLPEGFEAPSPDAVRTMMDYTMIQVGLSAGSLGYYKASISGYGERRSEIAVRYYLDALILVGSKIDNIYQQNDMGPNLNNTFYTQYSLDKSPRSKVGFCLGASLNNISRFGFEAGAEAAYVPGIKGTFMSNFCFSLKSSISIAKLLN